MSHVRYSLVDSSDTVLVDPTHVCSVEETTRIKSGKTGKIAVITVVNGARYVVSDSERTVADYIWGRKGIPK